MRSFIIFSALCAVSSGALAQQGNIPSAAQRIESQVNRDTRKAGTKAFENEYNSKVVLNNQGTGQVYGRAYEVAECLAKKSGKEAAGMVGGPMSADPSYDKLAKALTGRKYSRCVSADAAGIGMDMVNGALAEALLKGEGVALDDRAKSVNVTAAQAFYGEGKGVTIDSLGRCLAAYSPGLAMKVLASAAGTKAEEEALVALYRQTGECGVRSAPSGFSGIEQRAAVAVGLYHWLHRS